MADLPRNLTRNMGAGCIMARIMRNKVQYAKNFSLARYGSWRKAERAASEWVGAVRKQLPPPVSAHGQMTTRNTSGVVGVSLKSTTLASGSTHYAWHAYWPGNANGTRWGVEKYGDETAFTLAVLSRQRESVNRDALLRTLKRIQGTATHKAILKLKRIDVV